MKKYLVVYAIIWIAVSAAIIAGICITKKASCLWFFLIPACISIKTNEVKGSGEI